MSSLIVCQKKKHGIEDACDKLTPRFPWKRPFPLPEITNMEQSNDAAYLFGFEGSLCFLEDSVT